MTFKVNLVVEGVDTRSEEFEDSAASTFEDVQWRATAGITIAALFTDGDPVADACTFTRRLESSGAGRVTRVLDEFVNTSEVASRVGVSRQLVRYWVAGERGPGGFPQPFHTHGQDGDKGAMKVWRWADVNDWLKVVGLDDEVDYPTRSQMIEIEAHILRLEEPVGAAWKQAVKKDGDADVRTLLEGLVRGALKAPTESGLANTGSDPVVIAASVDAHRASSKESIYQVVSHPGAAPKAYK